jgi:ribosome-associated protein
MDYGDIIVHIFDKDSRLYYGLERLWGDTPRVEFKVKARSTVKRASVKDAIEDQT